MSLSEPANAPVRKNEPRQDRRRGRAATPLAIASLIVAVVALVLALILRGASIRP